MCGSAWTVGVSPAARSVSPVTGPIAASLTGEAAPEAARNRVRMNATDLTWGENHLTLIGGMILSENETLLDLALTADTIDWNQVNNLVDYVKKTMALTGVLQLRANMLCVVIFVYIKTNFRNEHKPRFSHAALVVLVR